MSSLRPFLVVLFVFLVFIADSREEDLVNEDVGALPPVEVYEVDPSSELVVPGLYSPNQPEDKHHKGDRGRRNTNSRWMIQRMRLGGK
uniref:Uncharacterized protein n=1 Tax=Plectus sambesii TaxID=2011161 RepID=A0A914VNI1_9BILA